MPERYTVFVIHRGNGELHPLPNGMFIHAHKRQRMAHCLSNSNHPDQGIINTRKSREVHSPVNGNGCSG